MKTGITTLALSFLLMAFALSGCENLRPVETNAMAQSDAFVSALHAEITRLTP